MFWRTIILSLHILIVHGEKLHEHMTKEEIQATFNVNHGDDLQNLEYEITPILHKKGRPNEIKLRAFDKFHNLYFEENDVLLGEDTPVYKAYKVRRSSNNNYGYEIDYFSIPYPLPSIRLYQDWKNRAAIAVHKRNNQRIHFNGVIGDDVTIRPIPSRVHREVLDKFPHLIENSVYNKSDADYEATNHIVIRSTKKNSNPIPDVYARLSSKRPVRQSQNKFSSNIIYPQLLITIDYETYGIHNYDTEAILVYMAAFWNSVDLRFRQMDNPNIRLNIAGLVIPESKLASFYFDEHIHSPGILDGRETLWEIGKYFNGSDKLPKHTYDIIVGMTPRILRGGDDDGIVTDNIGGYAVLGEACTRGSSVALIKDQGVFKVYVAAHELAHTMGAEHDKDNNPDGECPKNNNVHGGYIMSTNGKISERGFIFSNCSKQDMRFFLNTEKANCLRNKPNLRKPHSIKILPGRLLTRDEQCQRLTGANAIKEQDKNCLLLWCHTLDKHTSANFSPADGTYCGDKKICLGGECIPDPDLIH